MRIIEAKVHEVALPLRRPFTTGFGTIIRKPALIIELVTEDGLHGYGESSILDAPVYTADFTDSCKIALTEFILPCVVNRSFATTQDFVKSYAHIVGNRIAKAGAESAFWHLLALHGQCSFSTLLGGTQKSVEVGEVIDVRNNVKEVEQAAAGLLADGFTRLKLKIKPGWDIEPLSCMREKWPEVKLSVDGNASYDPEKHMDLLKKLQQFNLHMLEQPFGAGKFLEHAELQSSLETPICLDESIESLDDLRVATALKSCRIVNIKPSRVGGLLESIAIEEFAVEHGMSVWCGGMLETGIGRAFNIALASRSNFTLPADMSPSGTMYKYDLVDGGLSLKEDGTIVVPTGIGLGYEVNVDKLKKYSVNTLTFCGKQS